MNRDIENIQRLMMEMNEDIYDAIVSHGRQNDSPVIDKIFGDNIRIIIATSKPEIHDNVVTFLNKYEDITVDWDKLEVTKTKPRPEKYGGGTTKQKINLSKFISQTKDLEPSVKKSYLDYIALLKSGDYKNHSKYVTILSNSPIDIARMSDFSGMGSCHSIDRYGGENNSYMHCAMAEAVNGGPIAFLVPKNELEEYLENGNLNDEEIFGDYDRDAIDNPKDDLYPIKRLKTLFLKHDEDPNMDLIIPEQTVYGYPDRGSNIDFKEGVVEFLRKEQQAVMHKIKRSYLSDNEYDIGEEYRIASGTYRDSSLQNIINHLFGERLLKEIPYLTGYSDTIDLEHEFSSTYGVEGWEENAQTEFDSVLYDIIKLYENKEHIGAIRVDEVEYSGFPGEASVSFKLELLVNISIPLYLVINSNVEDQFVEWEGENREIETYLLDEWLGAMRFYFNMSEEYIDDLSSEISTVGSQKYLKYSLPIVIDVDKTRIYDLDSEISGYLDEINEPLTNTDIESIDEILEESGFDIRVLPIRKDGYTKQVKENLPKNMAYLENRKLFVADYVIYLNDNQYEKIQNLSPEFNVNLGRVLNDYFYVAKRQWSYAKSNELTKYNDQFTFKDFVKESAEIWDIPKVEIDRAGIGIDHDAFFTIHIKDATFNEDKFTGDLLEFYSSLNKEIRNIIEYYILAYYGLVEQSRFKQFYKMIKLNINIPE